MPSERIALKVAIYRKPDSYLDYPDFKHTLAVFDDPDYTTGQLYTDRTSDCKTTSAHSPQGVMWGMKLVDAAFAAQALTAFPDRVSVMTEAEVADFWSNRAMATVPTVKYSPDALAGLQAEKTLLETLGRDTTEVFDRISRAIDPADAEPGIQENREKTWAKAKEDMDITIVEL